MENAHDTGNERVPAGHPRVYSPSQTETWLTCPLKRALEYTDRWEPRTLNRMALARIVGTSFAAGAGTYNATRKYGATPDPTVCAGIAVSMAEEHLRNADEKGYVTPDADRVTRNALTARVDKGVRRYIAADPHPPEWPVVDVEITLPDHGGCRPDLVLETPAGLRVTDYKCRVTCDARYVQSNLDEYMTSEQRFHYPWAYAEHSGTPVTEFGIVMVVLEPRFAVHTREVTVTHESTQLWLQGRRDTWATMDAMERGSLRPWMAAEHRTRYGPCEFTRVCLGSAPLNPSLLERDFIRRIL